MKLDRFVFVASLSFAVSACGSAAPVFHDMALPADCGDRCPTGYRCDNGVCTGGDARTLALSTQTFPVSGTLTIDGQPPRPTSSCSGTQVDVEFADGPIADFLAPQLSTLVSSSIACKDATGAVATRLPKGDYHVLAHGFGDSSFPSDTAVAVQDLKVSGPISGVTWPVTTVPVSGTLTINGAPPTATSSCSGTQVQLSFVSSDGASFSASIPCQVATGAFSLRVAPGTYRVLAHGYGDSSFPQATVLVQPALQVTGAMTGVTWPVTTVALSGALTIDGAPPKATSSCSGTQVQLSFVNEAGASFDASIPCTVATGAFTVAVAPGTYRVLAHGYGDSSFPQATVLVQPELKVTGPMSGVSWPITTVPVSGTLTLDGLPPTPTSSCSGNQLVVQLVNDAGASFEADIPCLVSTGTFTTRVAPGRYRVLAHGYGDSTFPQATLVVQRDLQVTTPIVGANWALTTVPVSGTLTADGMPPTPTSSCSGTQVSLTFVDDDGASFDATIPCLVSTGAFSLKVAPGTYRVLAHGYGDSSFPDATIALVDALKVP